MFNIIYYILIIALGSHQNVQRMVPQCSTVAPLGLGPKGVPNPGNFPPLQEVCPYNFKALEKIYMCMTRLVYNLIQLNSED